MVEFKPPRGTRDFLPEEMAKRKFVKSVIERVFELYGFQQIQTPIFEEFRLLSARSGEEIREGMFTFVYDDTEYALRPELTAPVCRLVSMNKLQGIPKPYKLYYIGSCFRYERPQAGRYREFEQAGIELMGSKSPLCDAEVITIAVRVLQELGITPFKLKIGNIGIFRDLLSERGFDYEKQNTILGHIDKLISLREKCEIIKNEKKMGENYLNYIRTKLESLYSLQQEKEYDGKYKIPLEKEFNEETAKEWVEKLPQYMDDTYKYIWKMEFNVSENLANLLLEISYVRGCMDEIKEKSLNLLKGSSAEESLRNLFEVCEWLKVFDVKEYEIVLGVARGLDFYTGTVFEIDCPLLGTEKQICGGGRYDRLVSEFGGPDTPATGFAFGFDRLVEALEKTKKIEVPPKADAFILTISEESKRVGIRISEELRRNGIKTEMDLMDRDFKGQLGYANTIGVKYVIILGPKELEKNKVTIKEMETGSQSEVEIDDTYSKILEFIRG